VADGTVGVARKKTNVGVGVSVIVLVGDGVTVGVKVGGSTCAVCVAAAPAVCTIEVLIEFGSDVGMTGADAGTSAGAAQASTNAVVIKKENFL